jgi:hypothetical protein
MDKIFVSCSSQMNLYKGGNTKDKVRWRCRRPCRPEKSVRKGTFLKVLTLKKTLFVLYTIGRMKRLLNLVYLYYTCLSIHMLIGKIL